MHGVERLPHPQVVARPRGGQPATSRRFGYGVAVILNAALLYLVNRSPGWEAVPFLTDDTPRVLPLVNASLLVGVVANLVYTQWDPRWVRALGDIVTTSIGLAALVQMWNVFPLEFTAGLLDWALVARWVIGVAIGGSIIGIIVALTQLGQALTPDHDEA